MAHRSSPLSASEPLQARLRNLAHTPSKEATITIDIDSPKRTYTTLDRVQGTISITFPVDTTFDHIDVEFVGTAWTYVEPFGKATTLSSRSGAFQRFLTLSQPGLQQYYPENGNLQAGHTYSLPFVFVVPQHLVLRMCQHKVANSTVRDAHLQLPPTLGDKEVDTPVEDLAPEMASIRYGIHVKVTKLRIDEHGHTSRTAVASKAKNVRIVPASDEQPPLSIASDDPDYCTRQQKIVRRGLLKGKSGTLIAEAAQPQSFRLRADVDDEVSTMATVMLRFDPRNEVDLPPQLNCLSNKLRVSTFFSDSARESFPSESAALREISQRVHSETVPLSDRCISNVEWTKHDPQEEFSQLPASHTDTDLGSVVMRGLTPNPSPNYKGKVFYTTRILAPITLPAQKSFVPTFHTCLISRSYVLRLDLCLLDAGFGGAIDLKVPVQIIYVPDAQTVVDTGRSDSIAPPSIGSGA